MVGELAGPRGELSTFILLSKHSIKLHFQFVCLCILVYLSDLIRSITLCCGWWFMQNLITDLCEKKKCQCSAWPQTRHLLPSPLQPPGIWKYHASRQESIRIWFGGLGIKLISGHVRDTAFMNSQQCLPTHEYYKITQHFCMEQEISPLRSY